MLTSYGLLQQTNTDQNQQREEGHAGQGPRETRHEHPDVLAQGILWTMLTSPSNNGLQHAQSVASQERSLEPGCPGFSLEVGHIDMADHPHG